MTKTQERHNWVYEQYLELINGGMKFTEIVKKLSETPFGEGYDRVMLSEATIKRIILKQRAEAKNERHKKTS